LPVRAMGAHGAGHAGRRRGADEAPGRALLTRRPAGMPRRTPDGRATAAAPSPAPAADRSLQHWREALAAGRARLLERFEAGEPVKDLVRDHAAFIDRLLVELWEQGLGRDDVALVAVGGYGRGELHPHSDIDIMLL